MQINLETRIVIITGPSTTGKSTLARSIKESSKINTLVISHDDIASIVNQNNPEQLVKEEFYEKLKKTIGKALKDLENELIIFDVPGIKEDYMWALLDLLAKYDEYQDNITIIKMDLPLKKHLKLMKKRMQSDPEVAFYYSGFDEYYETVISQRESYEGFDGSLYADFGKCIEYVIENPKDVEITWSISKKYKKL